MTLRPMNWQHNVNVNVECSPKWRRDQAGAHTMASMRFAEAAGALVTGHFVVSAAAIGNACVGRSEKPTPPPPTPALAGAAGAAQQLVAQMYSGGGLNPQLVTEDVTFTDPAARCQGKQEVAEAFRALRFCNPKTLTSPWASTSQAEDGALHFNLHQRYFAGRLPGLELRSTLVVRTAPDGRVCELEERWNGASLLSWPPFRFSRRVNGVLSSLLTPLLLR